MNAQSIDIEKETRSGSQWNLIISAMFLAVGLLSIGWVFQSEVIAAVLTWEASTAYNHCFLIIPISLYMIWDRRDDVRDIQVKPLPAAALLGGGVAAGWLVAERLGIMEGRQLMVVAFVNVLCLAALGWRLFRALAGPILYLFFLVPFGEFLVPRLQDFTAVFIAFGLGLTSIPAYIDGYIIEIPAGTFYVAEACAGLRFLVASIAFGTLYAMMMYRSPCRRVVFILASIIVPIVANGFRALGIVLLGHWIGSAEAAAADHIFYGWLFFSLVILLLTVLGLPFREDIVLGGARRLVVSQARIRPVSSLAAVVSVVAVAGISPAVVAAMERMSTADRLPLVSLDMPVGCELIGQPVIDIRTAMSKSTSSRALCQGLGYEIIVQVFAPRATAGPIIQERRRLTRPQSSENVAETTIMGQAGKATHWRLVQTADPYFLAVVGVWIDGVPSGTGLSMRVAQAKASFSRAGRAPVMVVVIPRVDMNSADAATRHEIESQLTKFVLVQPNINLKGYEFTTVPGP